jgi:hypothetical protein
VRELERGLEELNKRAESYREVNKYLTSAEPRKPYAEAAGKAEAKVAELGRPH